MTLHDFSIGCFVVIVGGSLLVLAYDILADHYGWERL